LRNLLEEKKGLDHDVSLLFYPVRTIPRKNVEEAIFFTQMLNNLAADEEYRQKYNLRHKFHLVVSMAGSNGSEKEYSDHLAEFVKENHLPVTIGISDLVGLHREYDPEDPQRILKYGVADMYSVSEMVITTSVLEGFGFVFIEPWAMAKCVIGRNIPSVTLDFTKAGLSLDHLYTVLLINGNDYADLGSQDPDGGLNRRLEEIKKLQDPSYLRMLLQKNSAPLRATLKMFRPERRRSLSRNRIRANQKKVLDIYSSSVVVNQLYRIILKQEKPYHAPPHSMRTGNGFINPNNNNSKITV